jgi:hypothetical protein
MLVGTAIQSAASHRYHVGRTDLQICRFCRFPLLNLPSLVASRFGRVSRMDLPFADADDKADVPLRRKWLARRAASRASTTDKSNILAAGGVPARNARSGRNGREQLAVVS